MSLGVSHSALARQLILRALGGERGGGWLLQHFYTQQMGDGGENTAREAEAASVVMFPIVNTSCAVHITFCEKNSFTLGFPAVAAVFVLCRILCPAAALLGTNDHGGEQTKPRPSAEKCSRSTSCIWRCSRQLCGFFFSFLHESFSSSACEFTKYKSGKQTCSKFGDLLQVSGGSG